MDFKTGLGKTLDEYGRKLAHLFHVAALFIIGGTIVWSAVHEYFVMIDQGAASLKDILLLFIYLELGAMVGIYFRTRRLPVRYLVYVAITALTRALTVDLKTLDQYTVLVISGAILILALAVLALQFTSRRYGGQDEGDPQEGTQNEVSGKS